MALKDGVFCALKSGEKDGSKRKGRACFFFYEEERGGKGQFLTACRMGKETKERVGGKGAFLFLFSCKKKEKRRMLISSMGGRER